MTINTGTASPGIVAPAADRRIYLKDHHDIAHHARTGWHVCARHPLFPRRSQPWELQCGCTSPATINLLAGPREVSHGPVGSPRSGMDLSHVLPGDGRRGGWLAQGSAGTAE